MDIDEIYRIIRAFESGSIKELEIEKEGTRLHLVKPDAPLPGVVAGVNHPAAPRELTVADASVITDPELDRDQGENALDEALIHQKSPIVGTFYRAPAPGAEPFVEIGDKVKKGQILCIIEAMKLMNEIEAEVSGEIVQVFVENGQPVEYGEVLFGIRTS